MKSGPAHTIRRPASGVLLISLTAALLAFSPTMLRNNGRILLRGDFLTQQIPFMLESKRCLLSGTPFWSWNTFLGANFVGSYSFYVYGSPFFWPLLLVPDDWFTLGVTVMFLLKHVTAALGAYLYLARYVRNRWYAVLGALLYAFSFFTIDSSFYYHFLDVIALFPFLLVSLDRVLERKPFAGPVFIFCTFLLALTNYYFFIGNSFFFLFYLFFRRKEGGPNRPSFFLGVILRYGCGALLASFMLLPSALTLLETSKASESFGGLTRFLALLPQIPMLIKGLILPHEGIADSGVYFQFSEFCSNTAFLPLTGALFVSIGLRAFRDAWENRLTKFLLILTLVPLGNGLFTLFSNLSYTRWWYMLVLMTALVTIRTIERLNNEEPAGRTALYRKNARFLGRLALWVTLPFVLLRILFAYLLKRRLPETLDTLLASVRANQPFDATDGKYLFLLLFLILINGVPLFLLIKKDTLRRAVRTVGVAAAVCAVNYAAYLAVGEGVIGGKENIPLGQQADYAAPRPDDVAAAGTSYSFRTAADSRLDNLSMVLNRPGIRTFNSFKSTATTAFGRRVGYDIASPPYTQRFFDTQAVYALLGVKEYLSETAESPGPGYVFERTEGSRFLYSCEAYVPIGYVYRYYLIDDSPPPSAVSRDTAANNETIESMVRACRLDSETAARLEGVVFPCTGERQAMSWQEAAEENRRTACTDFTAGPSGFTAVTGGDTSRLLYFSVPHDNGWRAFIDGKETEIFTVNYGMMGIVVPPGDGQRLEFRFEPPGLKAGAVLSLFFAAGFLVYTAVAGVLLWNSRRHTRAGGPV